MPIVVVHDDFRRGTLGWEAGFADYSPANEEMELEAGLRELPAELGVEGSGFYVTGHNRSDDLFMFLKKKLTKEDGIVPNQTYLVSYEVVLASNAGGELCAGIGGHPGLSVVVKIGGAGVEPQVILEGEGTAAHYRVNLDIGSQLTSGFAASVAGDISTGSDLCYYEAPFVSLVRRHQHPHVITADSAGTLWLLIGTDSGFEGKTRLYYQTIAARLTPVRRAP